MIVWKDSFVQRRESTKKKCVKLGNKVNEEVAMHFEIVKHCIPE